MAYKAIFDEFRAFGVEIEVIGVCREDIAEALNSEGFKAEVTEYTKDVRETWKITTDSSLAGAPRSMTAEVVSPILFGREGLVQVEKVIDILNAIGCRVNKTCGFHVHWNCADFTGKNVLSLLRFYAKFERVIDYLVSPSRRGDENRHCRSMVKDTDLTWITELDRTERLRASDVAFAFETRHSEHVFDPITRRPAKRSSRYHKVNIFAYTSFGTVEFRHHQGTLNPEKAINWIVFTQQLVNKAKHVSVSKQVSAKPTLGEMLRVLKLVDHEFIENQCTDPLILELGAWLKNRYTQFREGLADE